MKNSPLTTVAVIFFVICFLIPAYSQEETPTEMSTAIKKHVVYLASGELQGRLPGEPGNYQAAEYLLNQFKTIGLSPINNNFKQDFPFVVGTGLKGINEVYFNTIVKRPGLPESMWKKMRRNWEIDNDWSPMRFSKNGNVEGELAFVGHGVTAKELNYDDYAGMDVKGKIVIVLADSAEDVAQSAFLSDYKSLRYKMENAGNHGAVGIIFVKKQSDSANNWYRMVPEPQRWNNDLVAIQANRLSIAKFFPREYALYPLEKEIAEKKQPKSFALPDVTISITTDLEQVEKQIPNIFGMIAGTDPAKNNQYIVVGAHFDHIGLGKDSSRYKSPYWDQGYKLHYGADDNASGTAALIELARLLKNNPLPNPVVFVGFNSNEFGTLGSAYFVKNAPVETKNIICMIDLDMVGRMSGFRLNAFGGASSMMLDTLLNQTSQNNTVKIYKMNSEEVRGDHFNFYDSGIPFVLLTTGMHNDYHRPTDTAERLQYNGIARVVAFTESFLRLISSQQEKPDYRKMN